jgi:hypothetical protein
MLKKLLLACSLIALFPLAAQAISLNNTFLASATGTTTLELGDTIRFEVSATTTSGYPYQYGSFTITGDIGGTVSDCISYPTCVATEHLVTDWQWAHDPGTGNVILGGGAMFPATDPNDIPARVVQREFPSQPGFIGNGTTKLLGTVTITADASGVYYGGAFHYPGIDEFGGSTQPPEISLINGTAFTVVPEPGTAVLMLIGICGLATMRRAHHP